MVEALLLGLVAFIAQSEYALGTSLISRPIVTGLLTGRLSALSPSAHRSRLMW